MKERTPDELMAMEKRLEEIGARYTAAKEHLASWRTEARTCYDYYANRQWSDADSAVLKEQNRPVIVFNRAGKMIDAVLGHENNNRNEIRYIPRTQGDAAVNEILTEVAKFFLDECDGEDEQSDAFRDMLITGMGWTGTRIDDESNPQGDLVCERVDPLEMLIDPSGKKPNCADIRYMFREKRMALEEVKAAFPDWSGIYSPAEWQNDDDDVTSKSWTKHGYQGTNQDRNTPHRDILVLEYQYREIECEYVVVNPEQSEPIVLDQDTWDDEKDEIEKQGWDYFKRKDVTTKRAFVIGRDIVHEDQVCPKEFTYHCVTGKRDREKNHWFGLMRLLMDPQQWSNKWLSQILHIVNTQAKGGLIAEESAVDLPELEASWAKTGSITIVKDGSLGSNPRVIPKELPAFPSGLDKLLEYANESFGDVSGINAELLGMADRDQPGVLEWQRKQSAVTLLAPLFDSLRRYRKQFGRCWLYFIQKYMNDGRLVRIVVDDEEQFAATQDIWQKIGDPDTAKYDVVVDQAATAPNQKEATWSVLSELMPILKDAMDPDILLLFLEYSPMPESLLEKLRQLKEQKEQQGPPPDPEMMKAQAQIQAKQQEAQITAQTKQQEMQMRLQESQQEMQIEREKAQMQMQIEMQKAQMQMEIEKMKAGIAMEVAQQKAQQDIQLGQMKMGAQAQQAEQQMAMDAQQGEQEMAQSREQAQFDRQQMQATTQNKIRNDQTLAKAKAKNMAKNMAKPKAPAK
jgi:hypothetical protein